MLSINFSFNPRTVVLNLLSKPFTLASLTLG
uniref:Uncharacterized protein n=1 Tax=Anguilla anguilla TaxID=7936 RepID=A0A0E9UF30_ANGAN